MRIYSIVDSSFTAALQSWRLWPRPQHLKQPPFFLRICIFSAMCLAWNPLQSAKLCPVRCIGQRGASLLSALEVVSAKSVFRVITWLSRVWPVFSLFVVDCTVQSNVKHGLFRILLASLTNCANSVNGGSMFHFGCCILQPGRSTFLEGHEEASRQWG